jgi:hypothetical protein
MKVGQGTPISRLRRTILLVGKIKRLRSRPGSDKPKPTARHKS